MQKLTREERAAIHRLEKALAGLPDSLWLFVNGNVHVMRKRRGRRVMLANGCADESMRITSIAADCDGGDF